MKLAINILQNLLLPKLEKDADFEANKTNDSFWESFAKMFLDFEKDAKPVYAAIDSLQLIDPEKIISQLPGIYSSYIEDLAEHHVLGTSSEVIDYLLDSENNTFANAVQFFSHLEKAIKKSERKRIKSELPKAYEKLTFELPDSAIESAVKKKEREALKQKMKMWDEELLGEESDSETKVISLLSQDPDINGGVEVPTSNKKETKAISLSWLKYAVAACKVLGLGVWFFNQNQSVIPSTDNTVVTAPDKKEAAPKPEIIPEIPTEALAEVSTVTKSSKVMEETGLGFASKTQKISIVESNQGARMSSIAKAIEKYQIKLEKDFADNKVDYGSVEKELRKRIESLNSELKSLKEREGRYTFDGKILTMYVLSVPKEENRILLYNDVYYLKKDNTFYQLNVSTQPQSYKKETNPEILTALDKIVFENDN